jgi:hypothetical protein
MKQFCVTTAMGKRLIGMAMVRHPDVQRVLSSGSLVVIAGTTNGYVAEEILRSVGQVDRFSRVGFRRGVTVAPGARAEKAEFPGDVVLMDGVWQSGQTIYDAVGSLEEGDVVLKGANAFDPRGHPAVQIGHPEGGTILQALAAMSGRRVRVIVPVGLEKRVPNDILELARLCNAPGARGPRLLPFAGETFTEIDALRLLTGARAVLLAAGGIYGAEGSSWLGVSGSSDQLDAASGLIRSVAGEPPCRV